MRDRITLFALACWLAVTPARAAIEQQNVSAPPAPAPPPAPQLTKPPELVHFVPPAYPDELLASAVRGEAVVYIDIDAEGEVERVELVTATHPLFGPAALVAATQLTFSPAEIDHQPAAIRIEYLYRFEAELPEPDALTGAATGQTAEAPRELSIFGVVREAGTRKVIAGAELSINGMPALTADEEGRFEMRGLAPGKVRLRIASPMHEPYELEEEIPAGEALEVTYYLVRTRTDPFETVVRARVPRREAAKVQLERKELEKVPGTFGDPVRVIENLPGMGRTPGGLGGALLVRGARPEDSRVFVDGTSVPLLYHFGGLTSIVPAELLERIDFYPGGFSARYGRATAGVVDVASRDLDCDTWRGSGKIDLVDSAGFVCKPIGEWQLAMAARRSYIDALLPPVLESMPRDPDEGLLTAAPVYLDYQLKAQRRWGAHTLDLFLFGSGDSLELVRAGSTEHLNFDFGMDIDFARLIARHRWRLADGVELRSLLAPGLVYQSFAQNMAEVGASMGMTLGVRALDWREQLDVELREGLSLSVGLDHEFGKAIIEMDLPYQDALRPFPSQVFDFTKTHELNVDLLDATNAYWAELSWEPGAGVKLVPGLRVERFDFEHAQAWSLMPRFSVRWSATEATTLKGAWGLFEKLPEPQWLLEGFGNPTLGPERAQHYIVGVEHAFSELVSLDVQLFYNRRSQLRQPSDEQRLQDGRLVSEVWNNGGTGTTYGLEVLLRHLATPSGRFFGWVAYTLSRSVQRDTRRGGAMQNGPRDGGISGDTLLVEEYLAPFDQTHILTLVGQWVLPWRFEAGLRWRVVTGNPYTPVDRGWITLDADAQSYGSDTSDVRRNSERYPTFHQLDVRIDRTFIFDLWRLTAYLELINAYNQKNVESYNYTFDYSGRAPVSLLPIIPVIGLKGEF